MRKHHSDVRRGLLFLLTAAVLLAVFAAGAILWERHLYTPVETTVPSDSGTGETALPTVPETLPVPSTEATMPTLAAGQMQGKQVLNILITGQDRRDVDEWGRSDTMILCSINAETDTVTVVSFLRDLYLKIPGHGSNRLNAAYSWGGAELLNKTLVENFDVAIDGNIEIDFFDFIALVDHLGGVTVELTAEEARHLNGSGSTALTEGENHLDGEQALAYSRIRYLDSDFVRTERQRRVLTQVLEMLQDLSWNELVEAMDMLLEHSTVSFTRDELLLYTIGFYPVLLDGEVITGRIPADDTWEYATVSGMSVVKADLEENQTALREWLGG